ncbi:hypothetical protein D3C80_1493370 [compost metagenome]
MVFLVPDICRFVAGWMGRRFQLFHIATQLFQLFAEFVQFRAYRLVHRSGSTRLSDSGFFCLFLRSFFIKFSQVVVKVRWFVETMGSQRCLHCSLLKCPELRHRARIARSRLLNAPAGQRMHIKRRYRHDRPIKKQAPKGLFICVS